MYKPPEEFNVHVIINFITYTVSYNSCNLYLNESM